MSGESGSTEADANWPKLDKKHQTAILQFHGRLRGSDVRRRNADLVANAAGDLKGDRLDYDPALHTVAFPLRYRCNTVASAQCLQSGKVQKVLL